MTPVEQLEKISARTHELVGAVQHLQRALLPALKQAGWR